MTATIHPAIAAGARALAEAERTLHHASGALASADAARGNIDTRIADLVTQRVAIVARRASGDHWPDDGGQLALIAADIEGLDAMKPDADAVIAAARLPVQTAQNAMGHARAQLARAEAGTTEAALIEHASRLDGLLLETVERLAQQGKALSRARPVWGPSPPLVAALRRLQAVLGTL